MNAEKYLLSEENAASLKLFQSKLYNIDLGECIFKKCCEKYKKGKRCKKCPLR
ncbi:MAG: hypothetical protein ACRYFL_13975 [Janthinobacterium lividum]